MIALRLLNRMFHEGGVNEASNNYINGEIKPPYLLYTITFCTNEEVHSGKISASPMPSGDWKNKDETNDTPKN